jgi:hypothetical protein
MERTTSVRLVAVLGLAFACIAGTVLLVPEMGKDLLGVSSGASLRTTSQGRRLSLSVDPRSVKPKVNEHFDDFLKQQYQPEPTTKFFNLPSSANEWCLPPQLPPINYGECDQNGLYNSVPLLGGLTNGLKMLLLSVIKAVEDHNSCFFIDETHSIFPKQFGPFLENYFEPIGLPAVSDAVQLAENQKRIVPLPWQDVWVDMDKRRVQDTIHTLDALGYENAEGHDLKRNMLRRVWRPRPAVRDVTCAQLESYVHGDDYIALSIRQGDKSTEGFAFATVQQYLDQIDEIVPVHFGGNVPLIFVATDDCAPLKDLRLMRPKWRFVSECDRLEQHGFTLNDHSKWSKAELDNHYAKFFVELFAMAGAKVWIGVAYTNVSWWVYFMRPKTQEKTYYLLDTKGSGSKAAPMAW